MLPWSFILIASCLIYKCNNPNIRKATYLQPEESALYDDLRFNRIAPSLRLEQERIGFGWVNAGLDKIGG